MIDLLKPEVTVEPRPVDPDMSRYVRSYLIMRIFIGALARGHADDRELPGSTGGGAPFFSPDGSAVAYFARGAIWRMPGGSNSSV